MVVTLTGDGQGGFGGTAEQLAAFAGQSAGSYADTVSAIDTFVGSEGNATISVTLPLTGLMVDSGGGFDTLLVNGATAVTDSAFANFAGSFPTVEFINTGGTIGVALGSDFATLGVQTVDASANSGGTIDLSAMAITSDLTLALGNSAQYTVIAPSVELGEFTLLVSPEVSGQTDTVSHFGGAGSDALQFSISLAGSQFDGAEVATLTAAGNWAVNADGSNGSLITVDLGGSSELLDLSGFATGSLSASQIGFDVSFDDNGAGFIVTGGSGDNVIVWNSVNLDASDEIDGGSGDANTLVMSGTLAQSVSIDLTQMDLGVTGSEFLVAGVPQSGMAAVSHFNALDLSGYSVANGVGLTVFAEATDHATYTLIGGAPGEVAGSENSGGRRRRRRGQSAVRRRRA